MSGSDRKSPNLLDLIRNDEGLQKLGAGIKSAGMGAARGLTTDTVGAPVDLINMVLDTVGLGTEQPVGGSKWLRSLLDQPTEDTPAELVGNLLSMVTSPGKAATDIATLAPLLGGVMSGRTSKLWNKEGEEFIKAFEGARGTGELSPREAQAIFKEFGAYRNPADKQIRQEISDLGAKQKIAPGDSGLYTLEEVLDHPQLFEAYPQLRGLHIIAEPRGSKDVSAYFQRGGDKPPHIMYNPNYETPESPLLHEIQHAIQAIEGFPRGGNVSQFKRGVPEFDAAQALAGQNLTDDQIARILYRRLAGEQEANMVQRRFEDFTPEELRVFDLLGPTIPYDKQILRY